jgi:Tfp pilus assembly protein PilF
MAEGRYPEARSLYEGIDRSAREAAAARVNIGRAYLAEKNARRGPKYFEEALAAEPGNIPARFFATHAGYVYGRAPFASSIVD